MMPYTGSQTKYIKTHTENNSQGYGSKKYRKHDGSGWEVNGVDFIAQ